MSQESSTVLVRPLLWLMAALLTAGTTGAWAQESDDTVVVHRTSKICHLDPHCLNRLHPDIPAAATAKPGQLIVLGTRNASDFDLDPDSTFEDPRQGGPVASTVHPLTGPVHIEGATAGDILAVTLIDIEPGPFGYTLFTGTGLLGDIFAGRGFRVLWRLDREWATSEQMPGIRIPNGSFPGVVTVLPGPKQLRAALDREAALVAAGGSGMALEPVNAAPAGLCGPEGSKKEECLRTIPPREHGGNMDIRYLQAGTTVYLPCYVDGCGLAVGDVHYAQGDGEVSGTAIEMDSIVTLKAEIAGRGELPRGPHFEGPAELLGFRSERFYATTGLPLKEAGSMPPHLRYLDSPRAAGLENLSNDLGLAARNALLEMIRYLVEEQGLTEEQAYVLASVTVDLRIGQVVDAPNVSVLAVLPLDVFVE